MLTVPVLHGGEGETELLLLCALVVSLRVYLQWLIQMGGAKDSSAFTNQLLYFLVHINKHECTISLGQFRL